MKNKLCVTILFAIMMAICVTPKVNAAIAIKEGGTVIAGQTISTFFDACREMTNPKQALEGMNVNPHMSTNREWATVSYFSNSAYGTDGAGQNTGVSITINGNSHYSTNGNVTGVIDWGRRLTYTSGLVSTYLDTTDESRITASQSLRDNANNSELVDILYANDSRESFALNSWFGNSWKRRQ